MKSVVWVVLVALVCVVLNEVVGVALMNVLPAQLDMLSNYAFSVVLPAVSLVVLLASFVLKRSLSKLRFTQALIFPVLYAGLHFVLLNVAGNPMSLCLTILAMTASLSTLMVFWRTRSPEVSAS